MSCVNCNKCHRVATIDIIGIITLVNEPTDLRNEDRFCFFIPRSLSIPNIASNTPVTISINGVAVEVRDRFGNPMTINDIRGGLFYNGYYGTEGVTHVQVVNIPRCRCRV